MTAVVPFLKFEQKDSLVCQGTDGHGHENTKKAVVRKIQKACHGGFYWEKL